MKAITILYSLKEHSKQTADKVFDMRADAITRASFKHTRFSSTHFFYPALHQSRRGLSRFMHLH